MRKKFVQQLLLQKMIKQNFSFSQIDCHGCGGCVSVCPSGAIDYAPSNKEHFFEMSKFYKDTHPLVIPQK